MLSLLLLSGGVTAQTANQVVADKDWATGGDIPVEQRTITVTVNDPDVNRPGGIVEGETDDRADRTGNEYISPSAGDSEAFYTTNYPIADQNGDGIVNAKDVLLQPLDTTDSTTTVPTTDFSVLSVGANDGIVTIHTPTTGGATSTDFQLRFSAAVPNNTTAADGEDAVVVRSSGDSAGIKLRLLERDAQGNPNNFVGLYSATFIVSETVPDDQVSSGVYNTFDERAFGTDANGDGTPDGVDLNGNGNMTDTNVVPGFYVNAYVGYDPDGTPATGTDQPAYVLTDVPDFDGSTTITTNFVGVGTETWDETADASSTDGTDITRGIDLDGDGTTTNTAVEVGFYEGVYNADLNGDGVVTRGKDGLVTTFNAAAFPQSPRRPILVVSKDDQVTITYNDLAYDAALEGNKLRRTGSRSRDIVRIESTSPGFSNLGPASGTNTTTRVPRLMADITDADSGVVEKTIEFKVISWVDSNQDNKVQDSEAGRGGEISGSPFTTSSGDNRISTTVITGGYRAAVTLPQQGAEVGLAWQVIAKDKAGNTLMSDVDPSDNAATDVGMRVTYAALKVDNNAPTFDGAFTGHVWKTTPAPAGNDKDAGVHTSVRVVFNEAVNPSTVEANDFRVGGAAPTEATTFAQNVYLTVAAQSPNATPLVELAGPVSDLSGNILQAGTTRTAEDGISPSVTLVLDKTLTKGDVGVTITTNEDVAGAPSLMTMFPEVVTTAETTEASSTVKVATNSTTVFGLSSPSARTWVTTVSKNETGAAGRSGKVNLVATAPDSSANKGAAGKAVVVATDSEGKESYSYAAGAISYELDLFINGGPNGAKSVAPTFVVSGDDTSDASPKMETSQASPFVRIEFPEEAAEYTGDTNKMVTLTSVTVAETPAGGTAGDAGDMMGLVVRRADNKFVLPLQDLTLGSSYEVAVNATDAAGNAYSAVQKTSFKVIARPKVTVSLDPGMNLVSFPEVPAEPGINEVFPADSGVGVVLSYDPSLDVPWLIAQRNEEGVFGEDAEIQSVSVGRAYWVQADGFSDVTYVSRAYIANGGAGQVPPPRPPSIAVLGGEFNLIGFISLTGAGSVDADDYLSGVKWQVAYGFNPSSGWTVIRPGSDDTVETKKGYIVFASDDGYVTP